MIKEKFGLTEKEGKMMAKVARRSHQVGSVYTWEKFQAMGYLWVMIPVINALYENKEDRIEGYKRHYELFNTNPVVGGFVTGLTTAMELQCAQEPNFDKASIGAVKTSLMGPFAGIGDSIFQSTWRVITMGIGLSMAKDGNILGPIVFLVLFNLLAEPVRILFPYIGYKMGTKFMTQAEESGIMSFVTKAASIVGLMTVGAMTATMVSLNIGYVFTMNGAEQSIQEMLDSIFPCMLPLLLTLGCFKLLNKNVKPTLLIVVIMVLGIAGKYIGIF
ncbi:MAG: PTS system mannose/fructose/sorbose family transporter subunit IID [Clostridium sp.]